MKLLITPTSPYVRKARVVIREKNISCEEETAIPWENSPAVVDNNPLRKVPVLFTDAGDAIVDSRVICDYLDTQNTSPQLLPADANARVLMQSRVALAEGAMDAQLAIIMSGKFSSDMPAAWKQWLTDKMEKALDYFNNEPLDADSIDMSDVTLGCLLGELDFRAKNYDWKSSRPALAAYWQTLSARPSFQQTIPVA